jgi:hypothetical protein
MPSFFTETENWESVEKIYPPPGILEPTGTDLDTTGSTTHGNVFNRRLQSFVNRTAWLRKQLTSGRLAQILAFPVTTNKLIAFDSVGNIVTSDPPLALGTVQYSVIEAASNPYQDEVGFWWFVPNGSTLVTTEPKYEKLYKAVWASMTTGQIAGGKGTTADSDWNAGKAISYPDCRDRSPSHRSSTRVTNQPFGSRSITLNPENFRHTHNMSLAGFTASSISTQNSDSSIIFSAVPQGVIAPTASRQNIKGNRTAASDNLGAIWENTATASTPATYEPPVISLEMRIYLGFRY